MSKIDLTGKWELIEQYDHGQCTAMVKIDQTDDLLHVEMETHEVQDNAPPFMVKQFLEGHTNQGKMYIRGQRFELINAPKNITYELDSYSGKIVSESRIEGNSLDGGGARGTFTLVRLIS